MRAARDLRIPHKALSKIGKRPRSVTELASILKILSCATRVPNSFSARFDVIAKHCPLRSADTTLSPSFGSSAIFDFIKPAAFRPLLTEEFAFSGQSLPLSYTSY
jgi:hypothetical protein